MLFCYRTEISLIVSNLRGGGKHTVDELDGSFVLVQIMDGLQLETHSGGRHNTQPMYKGRGRGQERERAEASVDVPEGRLKMFRE